MNRSIGYSEDELKKTLAFIEGSIGSIDFELEMIEEMGLGKRSNLDWATTGKRLRISLENLKRGIDMFGVIKIPYRHVDDYNYDSFLKSTQGDSSE